MILFSYSFLMWIVFGYVVGSVPFGVIIPVLLEGIDPRCIGSGNSGTTNVYRAVGWKCAVLVAILDILKGMLPVYFALKVFNSYFLAMGIALACVSGHVWSCFLRFKGGKGIATGAGVLFPFIPLWVGISVVFWIIVARFTRYAFLASIISTAIVLLGASISVRYPFFFCLVCIVGGIILFTHRRNFLRFIQGAENKIEKNSKNLSSQFK
ncbi:MULTISPECIES: glycerol-3-phosphate 1-O-acyltransferase PlsY [Holospora]|uniref:Glycerol-3-phosphate acyltransferase n=2 Tax=Holospora TaxID=44747 RepID=A0A061JIU0_9PROT|nr:MULTISPECIES: glycerol-3-phosphate 1-O-acyltransferase PlsY [Holospora]ETZ05149.1 glycerol-3-phosphate acyltransferase [Holospora undulata HU1]GAJ46800.1 glycerol-3-phosphate acyltransferase [Holospora elegans E1]